MFSKFKSADKYYSSTLAVAIASSSLLANVSEAKATKLNEQNKQLEINQKTVNNSNYFIASKSGNPYDHRVLPSTLELVKQYEGFRSYAYIDTSGLPVIGYGQSRINGRSVKMGQYITRAQADAALEQELYHIQNLVLANIRVELTPHQLGALTSLVYNAGTRVVKNSTLSRKLNAGDYQGAAQEFIRWNKANQGGRLVALPGLTRRRIAEKNMFLMPYTSVSSN